MGTRPAGSPFPASVVPPRKNHARLRHGSLAAARSATTPKSSGRNCECPGNLDACAWHSRARNAPTGSGCSALRSDIRSAQASPAAFENGRHTLPNVALASTGDSRYRTEFILSVGPATSRSWAHRNPCGSTAYGGRGSGTVPDAGCLYRSNFLRFNRANCNSTFFRQDRP